MSKKWLVYGIFPVLLFVGLYAYYDVRWSYLWAKEQEHPAYIVELHDDDTLRVVMIGDSWAVLHHEHHFDDYFVSLLQRMVGTPVRMTSKGRGGEVSRGIYRLMFESEDFGTKPILSAGADYCIISAGINDAQFNLGVTQYIHHMCLIFDFLLGNHICPVVMELPDVDVWRILKDKSAKMLFVRFLQSTMSGSGLYDYAEYREALRQLINEKAYRNKILYVPMKGWHGDTFKIDDTVFWEDHAHLNNRGYERLDSCIAVAIASNWKK